MIFNRVLPFIALISSVGLYFSYIRPTIDGPIAETKQQLINYDSALAAASHFNEKDAELTKQSNSIPGTSLDRLNALLPNSVDNIRLILDLNALAAKSGMVLSAFNISDTGAASASSSLKKLELSGSGTGNTLDSIVISFSASGTYQSFHVFLAALESSLRTFDVESVTIQDSRTGVYTYAMNVRVYWLH
jgi:hypothetical protein